MTRQRLIASVVFFGILAGAALRVLAPRLVGLVFMETAEAAKLPPSRLSTCYVLERGRWLTFLLPPDQTTLKLITNANVPANEYYGDDVGCDYTLQYVLLGTDGKPIKERFYSLRGYTSTYRDPDNGETVPSHFYLGSGVTPLGSRTVSIKVGGLSRQVARVDVRLASADTAVRDVSLRTYYQERVPEYRLDTLWARTDKQKRQSLARGNVYNVDLLTQEEKLNLMANGVSALAPIGVEEQDYDLRKIYTLKGRLAARKRERILPRGFYIDSGTVGTIRLPEDQTCVLVELYRVDADASEGTGDVAYLSWLNDEEIRCEEIILGGAVTKYESDFSGGLLEVSAPGELVVRAFAADGDVLAEITPHRVSVPAYLVGDEQPLDFFTNTYEVSSRVLRLDVRRVLLADSSPGAVEFTYQLLDAADKVLESGLLLQDASVTPYDSVVGQLRGRPISDASRFFFWLPPGCSRLRIVSATPGLLASGYTRLTGLPRYVRARGATSSQEAQKELPRDWFAIKPENYSDYIVDGREVFVRRQPRPRSESGNEDRTASLYRAMYPLGAVVAKHIFTPVTPPRTREEALSPLRYVAVPQDETAQFEFVTVDFGPVVTPEFLCLSPSEEPFGLSVWIDERLVSHSLLASPTTRLPLEALEPGPHAIRVDRPAGVDVYVNAVVAGEDVTAGDSAWVIRRTVYQLGARGLNFRFIKSTSERETLSVRLFSSMGESRDRRLRANIKDPRRNRRASSSWTYPVSVIHFPSNQTGRYPVLWRQGDALTGGSPATIVLGADLSAGEYSFELALEEGGPCYVQVNHGAPGDADRRRIFIERGLGRTSE